MKSENEQIAFDGTKNGGGLYNQFQQNSSKISHVFTGFKLASSELGKMHCDILKQSLTLSDRVEEMNRFSRLLSFKHGLKLKTELQDLESLSASIQPHGINQRYSYEDFSGGVESVRANSYCTRVEG